MEPSAISIALDAAELAAGLGIDLAQARRFRPVQWPLYAPLYHRGWEVGDIAKYFEVPHRIVEKVIEPIRAEKVKSMELPGRKKK